MPSEALPHLQLPQPVTLPSCLDYQRSLGYYSSRGDGDGVLFVLGAVAYEVLAKG